MMPVEDISYPAQMDTHRFRERLKMLKAIEKDFIAKRTGRSTEAHEAIYKKADELINSPKIDAFNLDDEPIATREAYGMNRFGQGCLMARRLVEAGVKFVEVSLDGWDTHQNNFERTKELLDWVDPAFAMLLKDLSERDLLDETIVLWLGEFGRTPRINENDGRDHHTNGWSAVVAGGGVQGGQIVGGTNEDGSQVISGAVGVPDLFASLCFALGIDGDEEKLLSFRPTDPGRQRWNGYRGIVQGLIVVRVIAGAFKGRRLVAPKGSRIVRPTTDRVKESVFSILREQVINANFLDLCAGTGSIGIEALSRGAKHVTFLERDPRCIRVIEQNLSTCGIPTESRTKHLVANRTSAVSTCLLRRDALKGIAYLQKQAVVFEIIYFDPPYGAGLKSSIELYDTCLASIAKNALLRPDGTLLVEHAKRSIMPDRIRNLARDRIVGYGDTVVSFYRKNEI